MRSIAAAGDELRAMHARLPGNERAAKHNYFRWLEYPLALALADPKPGERVLDVGSTFINLLALAIAARRGARVTALDRAPLTDETRAHVANLATRIGVPDGVLTLTQGEASSMPFADASFDLVLCVSTVEHAALGEDSRIAAEVGRVLAPGGRAVFTFPFNHDGEHIEMEAWHGAEYEQRHYNEQTARERVIRPSGLGVRRLSVFGEIDETVGRGLLAMTPERMTRFCEKKHRRWDRYWKVYFDAARDGLYLHAGEIADADKTRAGAIAVLAEKGEPPPDHFPFDLLAFARAHGNRRVGRWERDEAGLIAEFAHAPAATDPRHEPRPPGSGSRSGTGTGTGTDTVRVLPEDSMLNPQSSILPRALTINDVSFLTGTGAAPQAFESGQNCWVRIRFDCTCEVVDPAFVIAFHDAGGRVVAGVNTSVGGVQLGCLSGARELWVRFGMLNLSGGAYDVSVGAFTHGAPDPVPPYPYDLRDRAYRVVVRDRARGLLGVAHTPYEIELK
ncbi:Wzt carbohydrate-binding domain-containing protein [bacterium]|nr:Wzt carbohydrate-binding domain-containing protein [bacterium]